MVGDRRNRVALVALAALQAVCGGLALASLGGCPDDEKPASDADAADGDALPGGRTYLLAAKAIEYDPSAATPEHAGLASLTVPDPDAGADATQRPIEAVVIPLDLAGIPWASFTGPENAPGELPAAWLAEVTRMQQLATEAGVPVVLELSPLSSAFDTVAADARDEGGQLILNSRFKPYCYDPSGDSQPTKLRDQFAGFAVWATERFHPAMVVVGERLNLYEATCGASAYAAIKGYVAEAARRIKALDAPPQVVVSIDVDDLYGYPKMAGRCQTGTPQDCLATRKALVEDLAASVDVVGLESYPARAMAELESLPEDWLRRAADAVASGDGKTAITGTGLPAIRLEAAQGVCVPVFEGTEVDQKRWLDQVLAVATARKMPLVVWRSLSDLAPADVTGSCPCAGDFVLCSHFEGLGAGADDTRLMLVQGLWGKDGVARQAAALWLSRLTGE